MPEKKTIGQLMEEMRLKAGAREYSGHSYMDLNRFAEDTRHMIIFDTLTADSPVGWKGERSRAFLTEEGYKKSLERQEQGHIKIVSHAKVRNGNLRYGHFRLYLDDPELNSYEQMKDSPFTEDFKQELLSINGVEQVQTLRRSVGGSDFKGETSEGGGRCDILTKEGLSLEGDWDYVAQHLTSGRMPENDREILIADAYANNPDSNNFIQLGEEIELETEEDTMTVTMVGTYGKPGSSNGTYALDSAAVMITEGLAREMISSVENFDYTWVISADPNKEDSVTAALESVATNAPSGMGLYTYAEELDFLTLQQAVIFGGLQGLSWMIFLFGVVNLVNMTLSNQLSRRRELCMMRSVGMTKRQLYQVLTAEGMFYVLFSAVIALVAGTPVAIGICRWMGEAMMGQVMPYQFPVGSMLLYIGVLVVLELLLSICTIRKQEQNSLIEQMRLVE